MGQEYVIMLAILAISLIGHNMSVAYAVAAVLVMRILGLQQLFEVIGAKGISWGIILLTTAIMVPIATGQITWENIMHCFRSPAGIVSIFVGILVAVSGYLGVDYMKSSPEIATALIIGTMIGVFFFRGVPVGPLIAAGVVYVIMSLWDRLMG